jgi:CBS domain containing-hemolysin-like protein
VDVGVGGGQGRERAVGALDRHEEDPVPLPETQGVHAPDVAGSAHEDVLDREVAIPAREGQLDEGGGATSLGGYLFNQWDRLPEVGDSLVRHDLRFVVLEAGSRRIVRVRIERMEEVTAPDA